MRLIVLEHYYHRTYDTNNDGVIDNETRAFTIGGAWDFNNWHLAAWPTSGFYSNLYSWLTKGVGRECSPSTYYHYKPGTNSCSILVACSSVHFADKILIQYLSTYSGIFMTCVDDRSDVGESSHVWSSPYIITI